MPSLGADMTEGVLLEWLVQPGSIVHKGDVVAVVDTSKAAIEVECFDSGVVERLLVEPGTRVSVGTPLATIATGPAAAPTEPIAPPPAAPPARRPATAAAPTAAPPRAESPVTSPLVRRVAAARHIDTHLVRGTGPGGRVTRADVDRATLAPPAPPTRRRASPLARRLAAELGVDLAEVAGTGAGGAVGADDVRRAARDTAAKAPEVGAAPGPAAAPAERAALAERAAPTLDASARAEAMRATIANLMARSKREIPHYYLTESVDLTAGMSWLRERNRALPVPRRLVPAALLLKAAARAAREVPQLNGFWVDDAFVPARQVHLGVAISLRGGGLVAPAIHDAADLDLGELMDRLKDLVVRTRAGRLRGRELSDPTLTVSNLGDQGVESILGVIYPPQVALVGFGKVVERPWALDGLIGVRPIATVSLAADHRASDGATGARYLRVLATLLQKPEEL
jgi:pyruvate dehydrogenase E2 component (dihydrolipoamide acetyltransferase)